MFYKYTEEHPAFAEAIEQLQDGEKELVMIRSLNNDVIAIPSSLVVSYDVVSEANLRNPDVAVFLSINKGIVGIPQENRCSDDLWQKHDTVANVEGVHIIQRGRDPYGFASQPGRFIEVGGPDHSTATTMSGNVMAILISQTIKVGHLTPRVFDTEPVEWIPESDKAVNKIDGSDVKQGEVEWIFDPKLGEFIPKAAN